MYFAKHPSWWILAPMYFAKMRAVAGSSRQSSACLQTCELCLASTALWQAGSGRLLHAIAAQLLPAAWVAHAVLSCHWRLAASLEAAAWSAISSWRCSCLWMWHHYLLWQVSDTYCRATQVRIRITCLTLSWQTKPCSTSAPSGASALAQVALTHCMLL